jgi:hypothetical protein
MSSAPPNFDKQLQDYLDDVDKANSEASKAYLFLEFSRNIFKQINVDYLENLFPVLEKYMTVKAKTDPSFREMHSDARSTAKG